MPVKLFDTSRTTKESSSLRLVGTCSATSENIVLHLKLIRAMRFHFTSIPPYLVEVNMSFG